MDAIKHRVKVGGFITEYVDCPCKEVRTEADLEAEKASESSRFAAQRAELVKTSHVPAKFFPAAQDGFDGFDMSGRESLRPILNQLIRIASGFPEKLPSGIILTGPVGTGKTHLGICLMVAAINELMPAMYVRTSDLIRELKSYWKRSSADDPMGPFARPDILFIDELETLDAANEKDLKLIDQLIDKRWSMNRCSMVASNLDIDQIWSLIGKPAFDRIFRKENVLEFPDDVPSFRTGIPWGQGNLFDDKED
jgi:DNA replication protein DnaC